MVRLIALNFMGVALGVFLTMGLIKSFFINMIDWINDPSSATNPLSGSFRQFQLFQNFERKAEGFAGDFRPTASTVFHIPPDLVWGYLGVVLRRIGKER
jgi:hypothetical protein